MAGPAAGTWELADGAFAVPALDTGRGLGESFQGVKQRPRLRIRAGGCDYLQDPCRCHFSKGGLEAAGIGRSKGGLTTKIHAAIDGEWAKPGGLCL